MWNYCGMARNEQGLYGPREDPRPSRAVLEGCPRPGRRRRDQSVAREGLGGSPTFWSWVRPICLDALERRGSAGGHFREEYQTEEGEALRDDENFCHVAAWEYTGEGNRPANWSIEPLNFEYVHLQTRSYK